MKRFLLLIALVSLFTCFLAISVSAETPSDYIEFGARFEGSDSYITVYTEDAEGDSHPRINFKDYKFYSDVDFTKEVNILDVTGLDFSVTVVHGSSSAVNRMNVPTTPFTKLTEVKWFVQDKSMDNSVTSGLFNGATSLKSFDFGCATAIGDNTFQNTGFEDIVIPATVTKFGNNVFAQCQNLVSVKFEGDVKLGTSSFMSCPKLKDVDLGPLTAIGSGMFNDCDGLVSITVPNTVKEIGSQAFLSCGSLASITLHDGLTAIGSRAFEGAALTSVTIPKLLTGLSDKVFYNCTSLSSVIIPSDSLLTKIGSSVFYSVPASNLTVPSGITSIGASAFLKSGITSVTIPSSVTSIGNEAFANCKSLTSVIFEEGFSGTLGSSAFMGTSALTTLVLVEGITSIPSQCFWSCGPVESVTLPDSVTTLAGRAFNATGIKEFIIRETSQLKTITGDAFAGSKSIKSIYLPTGVEIQASNVFQYCHALEVVYNFENVKLNISGLGENVFDGKIFYECMKLKEIKIPKSATSIYGNAWRYYAMERIYIPATVTSISASWVNDLPATTSLFYCGADASTLLELTKDGNGAVSTNLKARIENGKAVAYSGLNTAYEAGAVVYNANLCDIYYLGVHLEDNNTCIINCERCNYFGVAEQNPVHNEKTTITYVNYGENGERVTYCTNEGCQHKVTEVAKALFVCLGTSTMETNADSITIGFMVNKEAISEYQTVTGKAVKYGVFAVAKETLGANDIFDENGNKANGVISWKIFNQDLVAFELKIVGLKTEAQKSAKIAIGAYVEIVDGESAEYSFIQESEPVEDDKYFFASYNDLFSTKTE